MEPKSLSSSCRHTLSNVVTQLDPSLIVGPVGLSYLVENLGARQPWTIDGPHSEDFCYTRALLYILGNTCSLTSNHAGPDHVDFSQCLYDYCFIMR